MNALLTLVRPFAVILAHRAGPDSLPASQFLLGLVIVCHVIVYAVAMSVANADGARLIGMPLIDTAAQAIFFAVLLSAMGLSGRIVQTLTAAFGVDVLLYGLVLPILLAINVADAASLSGLLLSLTYFAIILWSLSVKGYILQRSAGFPYFVGVIIALAFALVLMMVDQALFPA